MAGVPQLVDTLGDLDPDVRQEAAIAFTELAQQGQYVTPIL
jgi:hypothetical protein